MCNIYDINYIFIFYLYENVLEDFKQYDIYVECLCCITNVQYKLYYPFAISIKYRGISNKKDKIKSNIKCKTKCL